MTNTDIAKQEQQTVEKVQATDYETIYIPNVDISENDECVRLVADMPGVDPSGVEDTIENNVLTIEGRTHVDDPEGYELVGQEFALGRYRRNFTLANTVDPNGIKARVRHGVLDVTIPKREEVKSRKIEIGG